MSDAMTKRMLATMTRPMINNLRWVAKDGARGMHGLEAQALTDRGLIARNPSSTYRLTDRGTDVVDAA